MVTCMVTLVEDLFLLATDASTGRPLIDTTHLDLGLGGALLLDLVLQQRLAPRDSHVMVTDPRPTVTRCSTASCRRSPPPSPTSPATGSAT